MAGGLGSGHAWPDRVFPGLLLLRQFVDRAAAADDLGNGNRWVEQVVVRAVLRLVVDLAGAAGQQGNARNDGNSNSSFDQLFHKNPLVHDPPSH